MVSILLIVLLGGGILWGVADRWRRKRGRPAHGYEVVWRDADGNRVEPPVE